MICSRCQQDLSPESFHVNTSLPRGRHGTCKECRREQYTSPRYRDAERAYRQRNPVPPERTRKHFLKGKWGLTPEEYTAMLERQGGGCAICGAAKADKAGRNLMVDHCHSGGHIRGLLCTNCNNGLGRFRDQPELLAKAIEYLERDRKAWIECIERREQCSKR